MFILRLYTIVPASDSVSSLLLTVLGLVKIGARLAAKSSVLVSDTVDAADLGKLRAHSCDSVEDVKWIILVLGLKKRG
jgi:hypothetical protein